MTEQIVHITKGRRDKSTRELVNCLLPVLKDQLIPTHLVIETTSKQLKIVDSDGNISVITHPGNNRCKRICLPNGHILLRLVNGHGIRNVNIENKSVCQLSQLIDDNFSIPIHYVDGQLCSFHGGTDAIRFYDMSGNETKHFILPNSRDQRMEGLIRHTLNNKQLVVQIFDGSSKLYSLNTQTGEITFKYEEDDDNIRKIVDLGDNLVGCIHRKSTNVRRRITLLDATTKTHRHIVNPFVPDVIHRHGDRLIVLSLDGCMAIWSLSSFEMIDWKYMEQEYHSIHTITNDLIVFETKQSILSLWNLETNIWQVIFVYGPPFKQLLSIAPDIIAGIQQGKLLLINLKTQTITCVTKAMKIHTMTTTSDRQKVLTNIDSLLVEYVSKDLHRIVVDYLV